MISDSVLQDKPEIKKNKKQKKIINNDKSTNNIISHDLEFIKAKYHKDELHVAFINSVTTNKWFYLTLFICFTMFKLKDLVLLSKSSS
jgi:hypothetical protein